jgi:hypothetical protein
MKAYRFRILYLLSYSTSDECAVKNIKYSGHMKPLFSEEEIKGEEFLL